MHFDGRRLQLEGFRLRVRLPLRGILCCVSILRVVDVVIPNVRVEISRHGRLGKSWSIRGRLCPQLGQIQIGACFVAHIHRFVEPTFGIESIEDDRVDGNRDNFNDDFDQGADQGPILLHESVIETVTRQKQLSPATGTRERN